jgi:hypothetical protein
MQNLQVGQPCPVCGTPAIQGPRGAYCRPCYIAYKNSQPKAPAQPVYQPAQPVYQSRSVGTKQEPDWDKIREEKNSNIKWLNAVSNACLLASTGVIDAGAIEAKANAIYNLQPRKTVNLNEALKEETPPPPMSF